MRPSFLTGFDLSHASGFCVFGWKKRLQGRPWAAMVERFCKSTQATDEKYCPERNGTAVEEELFARTDGIIPWYGSLRGHLSTPEVLAHTWSAMCPLNQDSRDRWLIMFNRQKRGFACFHMRERGMRHDVMVDVLEPL